MKKKLMLLFSLFFLVLPISGCGGDGDDSKPEYSVSITLAKTGTDDSADSAFLLNDCASISGDGSYKEGENVKVTIKYVKSACKLEKIEIVGTDLNYSGSQITPSAIDNVFNQVSFPIINAIKGNAEIRITMAGLLTEVKTTRIYFEGLKRRYNDIATGNTTVENVDQTKFKIPYLEKQTEKNVSVKLGDYDNLAADLTLSSVLGAGKEINLNYAYLDNGNGLVFQPYRLEWRKGTYNKGSAEICTYGENSLIDPSQININELKIEYGDSLCFNATINTTSDDSKMKELKVKALENLVGGEIYVATNSNNDCLIAKDSTTDINETCMYVGKLKNIYKSNPNASNVNEKAASYAAITKDGLLEMIQTGMSGDKTYYICANGYTNCQANNAPIKKLTYSGNYNILRLNDFIVELLAHESGAKKDNLTDIVFEYDPIIEDIVISEIKIDSSHSYYITYIGNSEARVQYTGTDVRMTTNKATAANLYEIVFDIEDITKNYDTNKDDGDDTDDYWYTLYDESNNLSKCLYSSNDNRMYASKDNAVSELKEKIYKYIYDAKATCQYSESIWNLRNYMYTVSVDDTLHKITVKFSDARVEMTTKDIVSVSTNGANPKVCHKDDKNCLTAEEQELLKNIESYLIKTSTVNEAKEQGLARDNIVVVDISQEDKGTEYIRTYKFKIDSGDTITITYDSSTKKFEYKSIKMNYENPVKAKPDSAELTLIINSEIFKEPVKQTYNGSGDPTTTVGNVQIDASILNTSYKITDIYRLIMNTDPSNGIHKVGNNYFLMDGTNIISLKLESGTKYSFEYSNEKCEVILTFPPSQPTE